MPGNFSLPQLCELCEHGDQPGPAAVNFASKKDRIAITIADLSRGEGAQFDWEKTWESQLSIWSAT